MGRMRGRGPTRRVAQFAAALRSLRGLTPSDAAWVRARLAFSELALFERMSAMDQSHCVRVARWVASHAEGLTTEETGLLVKAALLHDVGKAGRRFGLAARVAVVTARAVTPRVARRLTALHRLGDRARVPGLRWLAEALFIEATHARLGARQAREAGADDRVVTLIRTHHRPAGPWDHLARVLAEADARAD